MSMEVIIMITIILVILVIGLIGLGLAIYKLTNDKCIFFQLMTEHVSTLMINLGVKFEFNCIEWLCTINGYNAYFFVSLSVDGSDIAYIYHCAKNNKGYKVFVLNSEERQHLYENSKLVLKKIKKIEKRFNTHKN